MLHNNLSSKQNSVYFFYFFIFIFVLFHVNRSWRCMHSIRNMYSVKYHSIWIIAVEVFLAINTLKRGYEKAYGLFTGDIVDSW